MPEDLTPKLHELRYLKRMLPKLKAQSQSKSPKVFVPKGFIDPIPCVICATEFDRYNHGKEKFEHCASCRDKLAGGQACCLCKVGADGLFDGRYCFVSPEDHPMAKALAGKIIAVDPMLMQNLLLKKQCATLDDEYVVEHCPKCHDESVRKRGDGEPENYAVVQWDCGKCEETVKNVGKPLYFDRNLMPVE